MIGTIIEIEDREGLFVVVGYQNYETDRDFQHVKDFLIIPYEHEKDDLIVDLTNAELLKVRGLHNPVNVRKDKKSYVQYGYSDIRGVRKIYLERTWEQPVIPGR